MDFVLRFSEFVSMSMGMPHQIGSSCGSILTAEKLSYSETCSDCCLDEAGRIVSAQWSPASGLKCTTRRPKVDFVIHRLQVSSSAVSSCSSSPSANDGWRRPVHSPRGQNGHIRSDLSVACKSFESQTLAPATDWEAGLGAQFEQSYEEKVHVLPVGAVKRHRAGGVPVFVMLPLDSINHNNSVHRQMAMNLSLQALKSAGVEGVMMDVWWGLVEREAPGQYNWSGYRELLEMVKSHGLKVQAVMSFHQCGGNVGDSAKYER